MVRFLADACLHDGIVSGCRRREPAMDFISAKEAQLEGVADPDVLAVAAREDRIVVTSDLKTMPRHFGDFLQAHGHAPGVFLVRQNAPLADVIEDLVMVWAASDGDEWRNRIIEIPQR
jgi:predicted nuclease of predicted toxin-antitoxin system